MISNIKDQQHLLANSQKYNIERHQKWERYVWIKQQSICQSDITLKNSWRPQPQKAEADATLQRVHMASISCLLRLTCSWQVSISQFYLAKVAMSDSLSIIHEDLGLEGQKHMLGLKPLLILGSTIAGTNINDQRPFFCSSVCGFIW